MVTVNMSLLKLMAIGSLNASVKISSPEMEQSASVRFNKSWLNVRAESRKHIEGWYLDS